MKQFLIKHFGASFLGALVVGLAGCTTQSGPTYTVNAVRIAGLQTQAYRVTCHGLLESGESCMKVANEICHDKGVTKLELVDGLHSGADDNDPREMTFACGGSPVRQAVPEAQPEPIAKPVVAPVVIPAAPRQVLLQGDANFDHDSAELKDAAKQQLDGFVRANQGVNFKRLVATGYTDATGSAAHNDVLSRERAAAVVNYLRQRGVRADNFAYEGRGAADPVASNATAAGRALNRRVEVRVLAQ
ncbi:outer membrane protein OmpA-like peptidoglycan-associated protein [Paraburkholderia sp. GAS33]|uniref:OmpA family protein n=1 Tax=Paraburkholderia sp. GAS33 TaxID=3035130 RepID=UPI003D1E3480